MPRLKSANFAVTELASGITNAATSFQVVNASLFPNEGPFIVLVHDSTPGFAGVREIMEVGSINKGTNTFSDVLRGREGTSAVAHDAGSRVECVWTAGTHEELECQSNKGQPGGYASLDATGNVPAEQLGNVEGMEEHGNEWHNPDFATQDDFNSHLSDTANYYVPPFTVPATDGTGEINAATITSAGLYSLYDALVATYPDYITREFLGKDASDTLPIYKYIFAPKNYTKTIIVGAGIHGVGDDGDPKDNPIALYYAMKTICENWQNDRKLADLRWDCQIVVMPIENPWGFDNGHRYNANGVDLNRNFDWHWEDYVGGEPYSSNYKGTAPFSEPETQYIRDTLMAHPEAVAYLPFHAWDDITEFKYVYRASSFSVLNDIAENLTDYLCAKYNVNKDIGTTSDTMPTAFNYAEKMLNIPSANPEYVVFEQGVSHRTSELNTRMVEWYLNWIYLCKLNRIKKTEGTWTPYIFGDEVAGEHNYNTVATVGFYKIIGDVVFLSGYIVLNAKDNNMAGRVYIGGLPFYSRNTQYMNHAFQLMRTDYLSFGTAKAITLMLTENRNDIVMVKINDNAERTYVQAEDIGNKFRTAFTGWYRIR